METSDILAYCLKLTFLYRNTIVVDCWWWYWDWPDACMPYCIPVCSSVRLFYVCFLTVLVCKQIYTPDLPLDQVPAFVALKSSDNVSIESSWSNMRDYNGRDLKAAILLTKDADKRYFNPLDPLHVYVSLQLFKYLYFTYHSRFRNLFNWVWPKIA